MPSFFKSARFSILLAALVLGIGLWTWLAGPWAKAKVAPTLQGGHPQVFADLSPASSYGIALAQANRTQRCVLVYFSASRWCRWCQALEANILNTPEFQHFAKERFVLLNFDFASRAPRTPNTGTELAAHWNIHGFPAIVLLSPTGHYLGKLGYHGESTKDYLSQLEALQGGDVPSDKSPSSKP
jgi:thiol:disulfide interchange protein